MAAKTSEDTFTCSRSSSLANSGRQRIVLVECGDFCHHEILNCHDRLSVDEPIRDAQHSTFFDCLGKFFFDQLGPAIRFRRRGGTTRCLPDCASQSSPRGSKSDFCQPVFAESLLLLRMRGTGAASRTTPPPMVMTGENWRMIKRSPGSSSASSVSFRRAKASAPGESCFDPCSEISATVSIVLE